MIEEKKSCVLVLLRFNTSPIKLNVDCVESIDAGAGTLTVTKNTGQAYVGYHIKFEWH